MSIIKTDTPNFIYKYILQRAIDDIKIKLKISDDEIEWHIFNKEAYIKKYKQNYEYGFCYIDQNQIYISEEAIMANQNWNFTKKKLVFTKNVLLIDVILDELVHIKTKEDHGNELYEETLKKYRQKYYE